MKSGTFMDIVGIHYDDIKRIYSSRDKNRGQKFCEDSFNEAFIKCAAKFCNNIITYEDAIRYFWVAYVNTKKNTFKYTSSIELCEEYSDDIIDDNESSLAEKVYDITENILKKKFGETEMLIYILYKYHNWSEKDLEISGYDCTDLKSRIKTMHSYVKEYWKNQKSH